MITIKNKHWDNSNPMISVITPVYNRAEELKRAMKSVSAQTYRNFEYIIVNDGSTENLDDMVSDFMNNVDFAVMYIKKENGGVHTARNIGTQMARGIYQTGLDSDDEFVPEALECFLRAWNEIPIEKRDDYREVVAQDMYSDGKRIGLPFPDNINKVSWKEAREMCRNCKGDHISCDRSEVRKANLFLEPQGVTFVSESVLWNALDKQYKSYFINDMLLVYHTETEVSYTKVNKKEFTEQQIINGLWNASYAINHYNREDYTFANYIKNHVKRNCFIDLYKQFKHKKPPKELAKIGTKGTLMATVLRFPSKIITKLYLKGSRSGFIVHLLR